MFSLDELIEEVFGVDLGNMSLQSWFTALLIFTFFLTVIMVISILRDLLKSSN